MKYTDFKPREKGVKEKACESVQNRPSEVKVGSVLAANT